MNGFTFVQTLLGSLYAVLPLFILIAMSRIKGLIVDDRLRSIMSYIWMAQFAAIFVVAGAISNKEDIFTFLQAMFFIVVALYILLAVIDVALRVEELRTKLLPAETDAAPEPLPVTSTHQIDKLA